jgi:molecular chaperone GrpE
VTARRKGEPRDAAPPPTGSFGDAAGEMANETEVEAPVSPRQAEQDDVLEETDVPDATGTDTPGTDTPEAGTPEAGTPETDTPETDTPETDTGGGDTMVDEGAPVDTVDSVESGDLDREGGDPALVASYLEQALAERTADLQRLQAEYVNYKRRVDRDRELVRENATFAALAPIVDVLDTIDRAREHGDLDEGFQAVAEQLERVVSKAGLVKYGEPGEPFDPRLHEALSHIGEDPDVKVTTCKVIAKAGYRIGERVVRAAQVLVVDPESS